MFDWIRRIFNQDQPKTSSEESFAEIRRPGKKSDEVVCEGIPEHHHKFEEMEWDYNRFGKPFTGPDHKNGSGFGFPLAIFKQHFRCSCKREIITSVPGMI